MCFSAAYRTGIPVNAQSLRFRDQVLSDHTRTLESYGVKNDDLLVIHDTRRNATAPTSQSQEEMAAELLRQQVLQDRPLFTELMRVRDFFSLTPGKSLAGSRCGRFPTAVSQYFAAAAHPDCPQLC